MTESEQIYRQSTAMPDRRAVEAWAAENVNFGDAEAFKGAYDVDNVPWTRAILHDFRDPYVREITCVMPPQESGKTKAAEVCMAHRISTQPAKMAFNTQTNVGAGKWQETRWLQMIGATPPLAKKLSANPHKTKKGRIIFRNGTFLLIQGAETPANRQSDSVEVQINDEVHLWEKPWLRQMHSRTRAYKETRKILNISLGANKGSELEERWLAGNQGEWSHHCPACKGVFQYVFDARKSTCNIRFDMTKVIQHADGRLDLREFDKTVHVDCPHCQHRMEYDEDRLIQMNRGGLYVDQNPDAPQDTRSRHVNAFAIGRRRWSQILEPWVRLNLRGGVFAPEVLRAFICEDLAEFWEERPMVVSKEIRLGSYTRSEVLKPGAWADEWIRVGTVDNQRGEKGDIPHRWFVVRAFAKDGRSRLVDCGRDNEWADLQKRMRDLGVPEWSAQRPGPWVAVDRRHDPVTVDEVCAKFKWFGMMGTDTDEFIHGPNSPHQGKRMVFSEDRYIDIGYGTGDQGRKHAIYYLWASQKIQDYLAALRGGKAEQWEVPSDIMEWCPEYAEHINAHKQRMEVTRKGQQHLVWYQVSGWADHLYDCESMAVVLGMMAGVFKRE